MDQFPDICELARALIRCPSVTPVDAGALDVVQKVLEKMDFICHRLPFGDGPTGKVDNLYAKFGTGRPISVTRAIPMSCLPEKPIVGPLIHLRRRLMRG